jgi:hypothetical protein
LPSVTGGTLDGFFVILGSRSGPDQNLWSTANTATGISRRWWSRIAQEINATHHLKTRLVDQTSNSQGTAETDWKSGRGKAPWQALKMAIFPAILPWLGIAARLLTADPGKLVLTGVLLCFGAGTFVRYWIRSRGATFSQDVTAGIFIFTLQFTTFYALAVLVTGAVLQH